MRKRLFMFGKFQFSSFNKKPQTCYYKILNVSSSATIDEIKQQYLSLSKKYHPDINPDQIQNEKFKEIAEAYSVLSNEQYRSEYDRDNGLESAWKYEKEQDAGQSFGDSFENIQLNLNKKNKRESLKDIDQQVDEYFQNKYFKNPEKNQKFFDEADPFQFTVGLYKKHRDNVQKNKEQYLKFGEFTEKEYYEKKTDEDILKQQGALALTLWDFKYFILAIFGFVTFQAIYTGFTEKENTKQDLQKSQMITEGKGTKLKMLPLNIN